MITNTASFLGYATDMMNGGAGVMTPANWHGGVILALLVGHLVVNLISFLVDTVKQRG